MEQWQNIFALAITLLGLLTGGGMGYLALFVKNKINESRDTIIAHVDEKFALREVMLNEFASLKENIGVRFSAMEGRIEALERRGH